MRIGFNLLAAVALTVLLSGCGETKVDAPIPKEKYEQLALEQWELVAKGKANLVENEKLLKKYGLTREQFDVCSRAYGEPESVKRKREAALEKMTKGAKPPPPK